MFLRDRNHENEKENGLERKGEGEEVDANNETNNNNEPLVVYFCEIP